MSQSAEPYPAPEAAPVGHAGIRVEITERPARAINGWLGVLAAAAATAAAILIAVQLGVSYWFYLYIPWFFAPAIVALLGIYEPPRQGPRLSVWLPPSGSLRAR